MRSDAMHRRLTAQGIPPRKSTRGHGAHRSVIERLRDPLYTGEASYHPTQPGDVRRPYGPRGLNDRPPGHGQGRPRRTQTDGIPVQVPALIDPETWERAQTPRVRHRERAQRHTTSRSLAESPRLWTRRPTDGGLLECPGRPVYLCPPRPAVGAGGVYGPQPGSGDHRAIRVGACEDLVVRLGRMAEAVGARAW
jgi:hypothetical protein